MSRRSLTVLLLTGMGWSALHAQAGSSNARPASNRSPVAASTNRPPVEDPLVAFQKLLKYGTWGQQVEALERFDAIPASNRAGYDEALDALHGQLEQNDLARKFMAVVGRNRLVRHEGEFPVILKRRDSKGDLVTPDDLGVMADAMSWMNEKTNAAWAPVLITFATQESAHRRNGPLMVQGLRAVEIFKPDGIRPYLKTLVGEETWHENIQAAALRALGSFKVAEDVPYFLDLSKRDDLKTLVKWTAVASLAEFSPDPKAREALSALATSGDFEIRARALWALGAFPGEDVRALLLRSSRDNNVRIRLFAIKGLSKFNDADVNDLLVFKTKRDPEASIRDASKEILKGRGITNF